MRNIGVSRDSKSGFTGVHWNKNNRKWRAQVSVKKEVIYLGQYSDLKKAISARKQANLKYGFHENHGKR